MNQPVVPMALKRSALFYSNITVCFYTPLSYLHTFTHLPQEGQPHSQRIRFTLSGLAICHSHSTVVLPVLS